jgi:hypothetical protein
MRTARRTGIPARLAALVLGTAVLASAAACGSSGPTSKATAGGNGPILREGDGRRNGSGHRDRCLPDAAVPHGHL